MVGAMTLRKRLKRYKVIRVLYAIGMALRDQFGVNFGWFRGVRAVLQFAREYQLYRRLNADNPRFALSGADVVPCLTDRTTVTPIEPVYFLQDTWFARKIAERQPARHVDIASSAKSMALVAQFVPVTFVDIRPVDIKVGGFTFMKGSVLSLPFGDASIQSLSSICVIEHIGLGRYGDPFDARGSEKREGRKKQHWSFAEFSPKAVTCTSLCRSTRSVGCISTPIGHSRGTIYCLYSLRSFCWMSGSSMAKIFVQLTSQSEDSGRDYFISRGDECANASDILAPTCAETWPTTFFVGRE
jgi:hypothetical protein